MLTLALALLAGDLAGASSRTDATRDHAAFTAPRPFFVEDADAFARQASPLNDASYRLESAEKTVGQSFGRAAVSFTLRGARADLTTQKSGDSFANLYGDDKSASAAGFDHIGLAISEQSALAGYALANLDSRGLYTPIISSSLRYEASLAAPLARSGVDIAFAPSGGVVRTPHTQLTTAGGEIRIGRGLLRDTSAREDKRNFYLFAGGGGRALVIDVEGEGFRANALSVERRVTLGDMQAGIAFERRHLQFSFGLVRRQYSFSNNANMLSRTENFGVFSLTLRR